LTLIVVSVITVRFSDMVLDSRIGALDRTLGFCSGWPRPAHRGGGVLFFAWLVPPRTQPTWVANQVAVVLQSTGDWLMSMLPETPRTPS